MDTMQHIHDFDLHWCDMYWEWDGPLDISLSNMGLEDLYELRFVNGRRKGQQSSVISHEGDRRTLAPNASLMYGICFCMGQAVMYTYKSEYGYEITTHPPTKTTNSR